MMIKAPPTEVKKDSNKIITLPGVVITTFDQWRTLTFIAAK
jgi:hypothetical protein